ncbi:MAG: cellulase family glycosylhydrolase, partial [Chloroflexota bacterium]
SFRNTGHFIVHSIGYLWRQIISPIGFIGKWVAQQQVGSDFKYIVSPDEYVPDPEPDPIPEPIFVAQAVSSETEDFEPAPLTGHFQLVAKQGPLGKYTALAIDGDTKPRLGVNIREFPHFGIPQWKWADPNMREKYCATVRDLGMKWIRFFTPHITYSSLQENLDRIQETLDVMAKHDLLAVVCLADSLADVGMFPKEDGDWHHKGTPMGHCHKDYFNTNAFRNAYHPYVKEVVSAFKDHAGVGMWQLMNEPAIYMPPATDEDVAGFARWVDETSAMIYEMDTVHPIGIGMINVSHIKPPHQPKQQFAVDFYSQRKHIHIVTCHSYQSIHNGDANAAWDLEDDCMADIHAAAKTGRAMFWTEFGASQAGNRTASTKRFLNRQLLENRASAALQWGFMITDNDTGVGDRHFGWSPANINKEYRELTQLFASYPPQLAQL